MYQAMEQYCIYFSVQQTDLTLYNKHLLSTRISYDTRRVQWDETVKYK